MTAVTSVVAPDVDGGGGRASPGPPAAAEPLEWRAGRASLLGLAVCLVSCHHLCAEQAGLLHALDRLAAG
jgi:hypothetical protein